MTLFESSNLSQEPLVKVNDWLQEALKLEVPLPHAMNLSTVDDSGQPSSRMVLLKSTTYKELYNRLKTQDGIFIPNRDKREFYVGSSIQFRLKDFADKKILDFIKNCKKRGVDLKWFGDKNPIAYTSRYDSWKYLENIPVLKNTLEILKTTLDMRIPLTFDNNDCRVIAEIIIEEFRKLKL